MAVDPEYLIETKLAHLLVVGLTAVGVAGVLTGPTLLFWIGYFLVWITFVELFEDDFLSRILDRGNDESDSARTDERASDRPAETADPVETLKRRYAEGELDEDDFERKLDRLLAIDDLDETQLRELVREQ
ncbi:SHOCT domain-containing protein [Salinirubrum litoreum]|uniref:SHOCT domain-containing protein n=1 Tax=Salinirubrum litoreum TaxID=1126234 RepID=A0ABD5R6V2_9EURY|nr:SHOCT domain-containing protein [Salinirubrum litoreum]